MYLLLVLSCEGVRMRGVVVNIVQVVNLSRSLARQLRARDEPITVNCICPGMVDTALVPDALVESMPKEMLTPMSTIIKAIEGFLEDASVNGEAAECTGEEVLVSCFSILKSRRIWNNPET